MIIEAEIWCSEQDEGGAQLEELGVEVEPETEWLPGCINTKRVDVAHVTEAGDEKEVVKVYFADGGTAIIRMTWEEYRRRVMGETAAAEY